LLGRPASDVEAIRPRRRSEQRFIREFSMKITILRSVLGLVTLVGAIMAVGVTAEARSVSAFAGQAQNPALSTCFTNSWGTVTNACSGPEEYCVPLWSDSAGHTVEITMYAPDDSHNLSCEAFTTTPQGALSSWTTEEGSPTVGEDVQVTLSPSLSVPSEGGLFVCCAMAAGARIDTINY
jgi:hypothetical protein